MKIKLHDGMVYIDCVGLTYIDTRALYVTKPGAGLLLSEALDHKRGELIDLCNDVAMKLHEIDDIVKQSETKI